MTRAALLAALVAALLAGASPGAASAAGPGPARIGSKKFTESVILGEVVALTLRDQGWATGHHAQLGGTRLLWNALLAGEIDVYPEYTGTLRQELLSGADLPTDDDLRAALAARGIGLSPPLGFENTYAVGVPRALAAELGLARISDLAAHPGLAFGFSHEFLDRADGWPALKAAYGLPQADVRGLDHDLAYRALEQGQVAATDLYSTDAEILHHALVVLEDDRRHFPDYRAVLLYRLSAPAGESGEVWREARAALDALGGTIDARAMRQANARVRYEGWSESRAAAALLGARLRHAKPDEVRSLGARLLRHGAQHVALVAISLLAAVLVAVPLGVVAARRRRLGQVVLGAVGVLQTIPSLALLVFMIPLFGIGAKPALAALFLYSLLPIVRNTHAGLTGIAPELAESAQALGLPAGFRLRAVELPLALPSILAGVQTAAVINVGTATLGALIGAGGFGEPILTGIRLADTGLILEGAVPAALLALAAQGVFELVGRLVVSRGLRGG